MTNLSPLSDADARQIGETTFDRNVVVLAGAGTGKTTLLVNRLLHVLLRAPHPFRVTEVLALTFTRNRNFKRPVCLDRKAPKTSLRNQSPNFAVRTADVYFASGV